MSDFSWADGSGRVEQYKVPSLALLSCESLMSVKEQSDRKKSQMKTILRIADCILPETLDKEVLNFCSNKAYDDLVNAKDSHKSWQAIKHFIIWKKFRVATRIDKRGGRAAICFTVFGIADGSAM